MRSVFCLCALMVLPASGCYCSYRADRFTYRDGAATHDASSTVDSSTDVDGGDGSATDAGCPMMCGGACTNTNVDPAHCGTCARSCSASDNGTATCVDGVCGVDCDPGFVLVVGACVELDAPRPIAPLPTATVTTRQPTLRWELAPRTDGARIELCADRSCSITLDTIDAAGTSATLSGDLPTGFVFWRLLGRSGADVGTEPSPTWQFYVGARSAPIDTSWGTVLDINGDGFADIAVSAYNARMRTGRVLVYLGSATGLSTTASTNIVGPDGRDGDFGWSVASAGDLNGDGFGDLIVGAPGVSLRAGVVYVYYGSAAGLTTPAGTMLVGPDGTDGAFGRCVASAGDVNGDGYADIIVGAPHAASGEGRVYVFHGSPRGLATTTATMLAGSDGTDSHFGGSIAGVGDVNGDGFGDVAVGSPGAASFTGIARIYHGRAIGLDGMAATTLAGPDGPGGVFGSVSGAGDVNGDGYADIVVGPLDEERSVDRAHIYRGSLSGVSTVASITLNGPDGAGGLFGFSVSGVGDTNGDGFSEIAIGAFGVDSATGRVHLYRGSTDGLSSSPDTTLVGPDGRVGGFGFSLAGAGDVNGDSLADLVVGAPFANTNTGRAHVFSGSTTAIATPSASFSGSDTAGQFGFSVAGGH